MGIVIGTDSGIARMIKHLNYVLGSDEWTKTTTDRRLLVRNMIFDEKNIIAFCINLSMNKIIRDVNSSMRGRHKRISSDATLRAYRRLLWKTIRENILEFVNMHNHSFDDVAFQCDSDCVKFLKDNGLHRAGAGDAYLAFRSRGVGKQ
ncbi:hypothetical protein CENSYa_0245 [Cenarchaeum symbiosum A]|uniref:Uncharacterized protein n=1 Tax=Cenarchaeum symbiosum (strain A) TaxID=414004 RepID=A0RU70_CENSY|nr:hypothetical protein CENSYa_0245 [Cenarchaeum symbiosum A]